MLHWGSYRRPFTEHNILKQTDVIAAPGLGAHPTPRALVSAGQPSWPIISAVRVNLPLSIHHRSTATYSASPPPIVWPHMALATFVFAAFTGLNNDISPAEAATMRALCMRWTGKCLWTLPQTGAPSRSTPGFKLRQKGRQRFTSPEMSCPPPQCHSGSYLLLNHAATFISQLFFIARENRAIGNH